jgi:hypothetical protein
MRKQKWIPAFAGMTEKKGGTSRTTNIHFFQTPGNQLAFLRASQRCVQFTAGRYSAGT